MQFVWIDFSWRLTRISVDRFCPLRLARISVDGKSTNGRIETIKWIDFQLMSACMDEITTLVGTRESRWMFFQLMAVVMLHFKLSL